MTTTKDHAARAHAPIIERHRLVAALEAHTQFTVVSAPAGSGKTILVNSWLESRDATDPYAWVSVERGERDPQRFWSTMIDKVRRSLSVVATVDELAPAPAFKPELLIGRLVADLAEVGNLTIVIDDVHEIRSASILEQLTSFLGQLPSRIHVVLISRHDPHPAPPTE